MVETTTANEVTQCAGPKALRDAKPADNATAAAGTASKTTLRDCRPCQGTGGFASPCPWETDSRCEDCDGRGVVSVDEDGNCEVVS